MTAAQSNECNIPFNPEFCSISNDVLTSNYTYKNTIVTKDTETSKISIKPIEQNYKFKLNLNVPKTGIMLVGFGGNNGSTFLSSILANKHNISFNNKEGLQQPNYLGSMTQSSTIKLGIDNKGNDIFVPFNSILPLVNPNDLIVTGWDINSANLAECIERSQVLEYDLQSKLKPYMKDFIPLKSIYYPDFIAMNQYDRANNCLNEIPSDHQTGKKEFNIKNKWNDVEMIRADIRKFKNDNKLDNVIVLWTANTERCVPIIEGINDTKENILNAIKENHEEIAPSTIFATAAILEHTPYINGSPQNTFVPGLIELAEANDSLIAGDDFKSGQTKLKSVLTQYLVDAGIKPLSIASYNHLGNNDGLNLSSHKQFRSKEISKSSVIDDCIESNDILYPKDAIVEGGKPVDHCIVIKYMKAVGDSKVAMDEYYSELMLGGHNRISVHNVCEDSLLATPLIIDLVIMTEFFSRLSYKKIDENGIEDNTETYDNVYPVLAFLSYWLKAPLTRKGFKPINSLNRQRQALENLFRLLIGLPANDELRFEERLI
ncbi:similar to Saccharomyces cerevisiae YJL153C INO1 Inositol-3-phosphate synthase, involved in synthesis of inositol phosphates and inositol-containing phospholipids [Maudiozyma saulgeensis]|uniref:Inositol-3-phosphate synthase n=1 Tax=Maudiozyma saulgeensis TaxID=1789683 RepID=A0A1X7R9G9_9SACH|nr:similar to Saccharomyces cerevisiae YJL153C INO1 Inositol-3-phosphate synthase, involved in synthesis of inositol phosphates and inositol-containing phospholipids [Kazachstania saulgeensis]